MTKFFNQDFATPNLVPTKTDPRRNSVASLKRHTTACHAAPAAPQCCRVCKQRLFQATNEIAWKEGLMLISLQRVLFDDQQRGTDAQGERRLALLRDDFAFGSQGKRGQIATQQPIQTL
jgi:hypothetical protein